MTGQLYLLHFHSAVAGHAKHYLGWVERDVAGRLERHASGNGARLVEVVTERGIEWELAARASGCSRLVERRLKLRKYGPRICPVCQNDDGRAWRSAVRSARSNPAPRDWWRTSTGEGTDEREIAAD